MPHFAFAIIGAGFGDEGKGLATDALTAKLISQGLKPIVVRSNGGAQAGHGVEPGDGRRHVFHHVGSGSFAGAATHLSRYFVAHPMMLFPELAELKSKGIVPVLSIDPRAPVTTPWDVMLNQAAEMMRGQARHGSCGMGFGETLERCEKGPALLMKDLNTSDLADRLRFLRDHWVPKRLDVLTQAIGAEARSKIDPSLFDHMRSDTILDRFLEDVASFLGHVELKSDADLSHSEALIFEGSQGLRLDQEFGEFPHVTRSYTGLRNMLDIAGEAHLQEIRPVYMTRSYTTRHGAGPLPHEAPIAGWSKIVDKTNMPNPWQGTLRFAPLEVAALRHFISADLALAKNKNVRISASLGLTCLDQITDQASLITDRGLDTIDPELLPDYLSQTLGLDITIASRGSDRRYVDLSASLLDVAALAT